MSQKVQDNLVIFIEKSNPRLAEFISDYPGFCVGFSLYRSAGGEWAEEALMHAANWDGSDETLENKVIINQKEFTLRQLLTEILYGVFQAQVIRESEIPEGDNDEEEAEIHNAILGFIPKKLRNSSELELLIPGNKYFRKIIINDDKTEVKQVEYIEKVAGFFTLKHLDNLLQSDNLVNQPVHLIVLSHDHCIQIGFKKGQWYFYDPAEEEAANIYFDNKLLFLEQLLKQFDFDSNHSEAKPKILTFVAFSMGKPVPAQAIFSKYPEIVSMDNFSLLKNYMSSSTILKDTPENLPIIFAEIEKQANNAPNLNGLIEEIFKKLVDIDLIYVFDKAPQFLQKCLILAKQTPANCPNLLQAMHSLPAHYLGHISKYAPDFFLPVFSLYQGPSILCAKLSVVDEKQQTGWHKLVKNCSAAHLQVTLSFLLQSSPSNNAASRAKDICNTFKMKTNKDATVWHYLASSSPEALLECIKILLKTNKKVSKIMNNSFDLKDSNEETVWSLLGNDTPLTNTIKLMLLPKRDKEEVLVPRRGRARNNVTTFFNPTQAMLLDNPDVADEQLNSEQPPNEPFQGGSMGNK